MATTKSSLPAKPRSGNRLGVAKTKSVGQPARAPTAIRDGIKSSMLHIRLDDALKQDATSTLEKIGISLPEAIRVFLKRIVREQAFPFKLEVPNTETEAALRESQSTGRRRFATAQDMFDALEKGTVR